MLEVAVMRTDRTRTTARVDRRGRSVRCILALCAVIALVAPGNAEAFARLYGLVRFFHPSDAAAELDWNPFALHGMARVLEAGEVARLLEPWLGQSLSDHDLPLPTRVMVGINTIRAVILVFHHFPFGCV